MSSGNWGNIPTRRTRGSQRRRIILSVASVAALVVLVVLGTQFFRGSFGEAAGPLLLIGFFLVAGVFWDLRPWRRD